MKKCLTNEDDNKNNRIKILANKNFLKITTSYSKINLPEAKIYSSRKSVKIFTGREASEILPESGSRVLSAGKIWATKLGVRRGGGGGGVLQVLI